MYIAIILLLQTNFERKMKSTDTVNIKDKHNIQYIHLKFSYSKAI